MVVSLMKIALCLLLVFSSTLAMAESNPNLFPASAVEFLDAALPQMEKAVAAKDRAFFKSESARMQIFLESWGFNSPQSAALEKYPMCTDAVTDYLIVGLCQISPPGTICEPSTFIPKFNAHLQQCRDAAKANKALQPTDSPSASRG